MSVIGILGAGVMGSAMCMPAADRGHDIHLVGTHLDNSIVETIQSSGKHPKLNVSLPKRVQSYHHLEFKEAAKGADLIVLGVSSAGVGWAIDRLCETLEKSVPVVMITKGMHPGKQTLTALPDFVEREVKARKGLALPIAAIGGPCIAGELAARRQTGTVIVSRVAGLAADLCRMFETSYYQPRASDDMIGVEVCAAFKNFYAIAVGWAAGQRDVLPAPENGAFNHNAAAVIFDQAIIELARLTRALGGREDAAWGMPGAGDLYVTCMAGRNSRLGNNLGRGLRFDEVRNGPMKGETIEGAELGRATAASLREMASVGAFGKGGLPLAEALLDTLTKDVALEIPWGRFHR
jgi:glycerol-3-phosphate dehydrogenase (NAD(P)+)